MSNPSKLVDINELSVYKGQIIAVTDNGEIARVKVDNTGALRTTGNVAPTSVSLPILIRYLDENGDASGNFNANGDYLSESKDFYIQPPVGEVYVLTRLIITVRDGGSLDSGGYGNGGALTNGVKLIHSVNGVERTINGQDPIKTNSSWGSLCYDINFENTGSGDEFLVSRFTFSKTGQDIVLSSDDKFIVRLNDEHDNLVSHLFMIQGYIDTV